MMTGTYSSSPSSPFSSSSLPPDLVVRTHGGEEEEEEEEEEEGEENLERERSVCVFSIAPSFSVFTVNKPAPFLLPSSSSPIVLRGQKTVIERH